MAHVEEYKSIEELKASAPIGTNISMEEAILKVIGLMELYASIDKNKRLPVDKTDDSIHWVELKWPTDD